MESERNTFLGDPLKKDAPICFLKGHWQDIEATILVFVPAFRI